MLATTFMLARVEQTCRDLVVSHLDDGEDSVGMRVEIDHLGPTLAGMWIEVSARVVSLDGQRIELAADICDALGQVGRARHTRFVIDKGRQRERLAASAGPRRRPPARFSGRGRTRTLRTADGRDRGRVGRRRPHGPSGTLPSVSSR